MTTLEAIQAHWNQQASKGAVAGTPDLLGKQLEQRALLHAIGETAPRTVLEVGCGLGETARLIVETFPQIDLLAVDGAAAMIQQAQADPVLSSRLRFRVADALALPDGLWDVIYTQRMLINLPTWDLQSACLTQIAARLHPGGRYLMCENSQDGLDAINQARVALGLPPMVRPWHNRYLSDAELATVTALRLVRCVPYSATYYFLSRVVNAALAQEQGQAPQYDAPINQLALTLEPHGPWAQGRLWIWEKPITDEDQYGHGV